VPPATKTPPPVGFTGAEGRDTDPLDLVGWAKTHADHSIALRMPETVIGIDVDQYVKGGQAEARRRDLRRPPRALWGPLPATWTSTAERPTARAGSTSSGCRRSATPPAWPPSTTGDVEIIQRHHRYAVVWPSFHHKDAGTYTWYDPSGAASDHPPKPDELPELLPDAWVEGLAEGAAKASASAPTGPAARRCSTSCSTTGGPECAEVTSARLTGPRPAAARDAGSRHDTMTERTHHLVQLAASGHTGVAPRCCELREPGPP
jgi:hypothetical protein